LEHSLAPWAVLAALALVAHAVDDLHVISEQSGCRL